MRGGAYNIASFTARRGAVTTAPGPAVRRLGPGAPATAVRLPSVGFRCCLPGQLPTVIEMKDVSDEQEARVCARCACAAPWRSPPATAQAQALRPNILILLRYVGLDALQPGQRRLAAVRRTTRNGQTSRVYNMKNAIRDALAQVGTDEANFGLMRFPQIENARARRGCPRRTADCGNAATPAWAATSAAG